MKITLQNVKRKFAQWRSAKQSYREKIPEELLKLASACAFKFGNSLTLKALNLSTLKLNIAIQNYPDFAKSGALEKHNTNASSASEVTNTLGTTADLFLAPNDVPPISSGGLNFGLYQSGDILDTKGEVCRTGVTNKIIPTMEFLEVKFPQSDLSIEDKTQINKERVLPPVILYELENKHGVKLRVFSESELLQKNIFSAFSLGG